MMSIMEMAEVWRDSGSLTVVGLVRYWTGSGSVTVMMRSGNGDGRISEMGCPGMTHTMDGNCRAGVAWEGCN